MTHTKDEALDKAAEFDKRFTSMNGIDVPERVSVPRDEWRALHAAIMQALAAQPAPVPLTDEQIVAKALHLSGLGTSPDVLLFARAIEAANGITKGQP